MPETLDLLYSSLEEAINETKAWSASNLVFNAEIKQADGKFVPCKIDLAIILQYDIIS